MANDKIEVTVKLEQLWVPVEMALPEPGTSVIVTARLKSGQLVVRAATYTAYGFSGNGNMTDVLAWIPMPGPYGEDEE